jgi:hypothetical protein
LEALLPINKNIGIPALLRGCLVQWETGGPNLSARRTRVWLPAGSATNKATTVVYIVHQKLCETKPAVTTVTAGIQRIYDLKCFMGAPFRLYKILMFGDLSRNEQSAQQYDEG